MWLVGGAGGVERQGEGLRWLNPNVCPTPTRLEGVRSQTGLHWSAVQSSPTWVSGLATSSTMLVHSSLESAATASCLFWTSWPLI